MKHKFIHTLTSLCLLTIISVVVNDCKPKETGDEVIKGFLITDFLLHTTETTPNGQVSTFAGSGTIGSTNANGALATFNVPSGLTIDSSGAVYVADTENLMIRKITSAGSVITLAGGSGSFFTNGTGTAAGFYFPTGIVVDSSGTVFVAETLGLRIRKVTSSGVVTGLAGAPGSSGSIDGVGTSARFNSPSGVAVDSIGNVYVADTGNNKIRKITSDGIVSTFAGSGVSGSTDGDGSVSSFLSPSGITIDMGGNIYVGDSRNNKIRKITPAAVVTTFAGSGTAGSTDGLGTMANFNYPVGLAFDTNGNLFVADRLNNKIRKITPDGNVTTFAGNGTVGSTDGIRTSASFYYPSGIAIGPDGYIYVADSGNNKIRKIAP